MFAVLKTGGKQYKVAKNDVSDGGEARRPRPATP